MSNINTYDYKSDHSLSDKWKYRFAFYEKNGYPSFWGMSPAWKNAYKEMTFGQKIKVSFNFFAWFFSIIYLLILGLWKKALLVLVINVVVIVFAIIFNLGFLGYMVNALIACRANIWYYDLKVKGKQDWSL